MRKIHLPPLAFAALLLLAACTREQSLLVRDEANTSAEKLLEMERYLHLPPNSDNYGLKLPNYLLALGMQPQPIDNGKATLGRVLFYDKNLSRDRSISCASCHKQALAFSDNEAFSRGIEGRHSLRNAMPLSNVASVSAHYRGINGKEAPVFLWDNRAASIAELSKMAFGNENEMGLTMPQVVERVAALPYYPYLWEKTYGEQAITEARVLECLSEFVKAMGSYNSPLDRSLEQASGNINQTAQDTLVVQIYYDTTGIPTSGTVTTIVKRRLPGLSNLEDDGRRLFVAKCTKCHSPVRPFQEVFEACNGLEMEYKDNGKGDLTKRGADNGVFKSPPLRNIALTAPYMHDGRFKTLEEVVEFYSTGVKDHPNLHPTMRDEQGRPGFHFSPDDKKALLAFLHTLTDRTIAQDQRFSDPILR